MIKKIISVLLLFSIPLFINAQNKGCNDSISLNKFIPSRFTSYGIDPFGTPYYSPQRDASDNIYISGFTSSGPFNMSYSSIIKFNAKNELVWYKNYIPAGPLPWFGFLGYGALTGLDDSANLLLYVPVGNSTNPFSSFSQITKVDSAGNFKWSKQYKRADDPNMSGGFGVPIVDNFGNLYTRGGFIDDLYQSHVITSISANGSVKWVKRYYQTGIFKYHLLSTGLVSQDANTLVLYQSFFYNSDDILDPSSKFAVQLLKINKADGSIRLQKSFMYVDSPSSGNFIKCYTDKMTYNPATGLFLLNSWNFESSLKKQNQLLSLLDTNFNVVKSVFYLNSLQSNSYTKKTTNRENYTTVFQPESNPRRLLYVAIDNNLEIASQKIIDLSNLGFPNYNFTGDIGYKKNGILNFQLGTLAYNSTNSLYLFDNSPFYNGISPCLGRDTVLFTKAPVYTFPVTNVPMYDVGTVPITVTNLVPDNMPPLDLTLPKQEICKEVSICDTIKLFGTGTYHCLSNPLDSFKIVRNPLCKRKTNWQVDSNFIKILNRTDTTLLVQYLQPYRGNIKVGFGGCTLTDSLPIQIYAPKTGINLGNDTMQCPGKNIALKAGKGFKNYQWQDGSFEDSLVATLPGLYWVTVTDSCGNVFSDSLYINPFDGVLQIDYPKQICNKDTISISLPANLYNYSWLPASSASLQNFTWRLFPSASTVFSLSAQRMPGCTLTDTVLVLVKDCPEYIYFPNAFTPNEDGLNDTYKPGFSGQLVVYELSIFNRYGEPVFFTNDPTKGWNGKFKNSNKTLPGTYVWVCRYQFNNKLLKQEKGTFTLIR